jgi:acyl-CoA thioesterase FadM
MIIDCHAVCTAIADAYKGEGRPIGSLPMIWYATGTLKVDYRRPTPIDRPIQLRARILERSARKSRLVCTVRSETEECAHGDIVAVRVPNEWFGGI